ncbi:MAG: hypothetical protein JO210_07695 [Acidobacteriaceae bacterium]|nr:hypothetical protein [Acidobacteriaceae bacterium]
MRRICSRLPLVGFLLLVRIAGDSSAANLPAIHSGHKKWTTERDLPAGIPYSIAQTTDGYLWFGTQSGLVRFDGVRYVRWSAGSDKLSSSFIYTLLGSRDGSLWIGSDQGLSRWWRGKLVDYPRVHGFVSSIVEDHDSTIKFTQVDEIARTAALCSIRDAAIRCSGENQGMPLRGPFALIQNVAELSYVTDDRSLLQCRYGTMTRSELRALPRGSIDGIRAMAATTTGVVWVGVSRAGSGLGLQKFQEGKWTSLKTSDFDSSALAVYALLLDRQGALWVGTAGQGLFRITGEKVARFQKRDGLSSDSINGLFQDREGNVWVATSAGVDCFSDLPVLNVPGAEGPSEDEADGVLATRDGTIWVARPTSLDAIRQGGTNYIQARNGLPGAQPTSLFEDHEGKLWVGTDDKLSVYEHGRFEPVRRAGNRPVGVVAGIAEDTDNNIWAEVFSSARTLLRIRDRRVVEEFAASVIPAGRKIAADPRGGIWLGLLDGNLARYRDSKLERFNYPQGDRLPEVKQLTVTWDGTVLAATRKGLIGWKDGKKLTLTAQNGLPCNGVFSQVFDAHASLWMSTECGIVQITAPELRNWLRNPAARLKMRVLDVLDGVRPGDPPYNGAASGRDGRLWFVNWPVLQVVEPARLDSNRLAPPVHIEEMTADTRRYSTDNPIDLPPRPRALEIHYTALSFTVPEKVQFRYKLEGYDVDWQEPGTRRQAFYSNLGPGKYRFRVIACNNDGVWNQRGAALDFTVTPTWYETSWFRACCMATASLLLWMLYQFRINRIARQFQMELEASLAERTRIARELHDTLLQSFHGLMFRFQAARNMLPQRPQQALEALDGALTRTERAIAESREAIANLRGASLRDRDLPESISALGQELTTSYGADEPAPAFELTVEGKPRQLSAVMKSEVCRIANEVLTNAFRHADAQRIEAEIRYDPRFLRLRFRDDGKGLDPNILKGGERPGHWGLKGIRERAERMGAALELWSEAGAGTEVQLKIPAVFAYARSHTRMWFRLNGRSHGQRP